MFRRALVAALFVFGVSAPVVAQFTPPNVCAANLTNSMACVIPQTYGATGLSLPNPSHEAHFATQSAAYTSAINVSLGTELNLLPLPSPASGLIFTTDPSLGTVTRSNESYGPILSERAETIGRHRFYLAGTYQYFNYSSIDGIDLKNVPIVYGHAQFDIPHGSGNFPPYEQDYITTQNRLDLKAHQVTFYATYGLTNRIDISAAIPIVDVRLGFSSNATIVRVSQPNNAPVPTTDPFYGSTNGTGYYHYFNAADPAGSLNKTYSTYRSASGIGDVVFRVKGTVIKQEHLGVAVGVDVRTPTGDAKNFLGSGGPGVKAFGAASYRARVSPHINLGYGYNGQSILAGNLETNTTGKLPNEFFYSGGVDVGITKRWTIAADLLGTRLSNSVRVKRTDFVDVNGTASNSQTISVYRDSVNMDDISVGTKFSPFGNFLVTANVIFKANDPGLRANVVPLIGLSYSF